MAMVPTVRSVHLICQSLLWGLLSLCSPSSRAMDLRGWVGDSGDHTWATSCNKATQMSTRNWMWESSKPHWHHCGDLTNEEEPRTWGQYHKAHTWHNIDTNSLLQTLKYSNSISGLCILYYVLPNKTHLYLFMIEYYHKAQCTVL